MPEFEIKLRKNFTVMSNHHLQNEGLSLKAKGLLSYMFSLPDDWDYSVAGLAKKNKEGKAAIRSALVELEDAGYLIRIQVRSEDGSFAGNRYIVYEIPHKGDGAESPLFENCTTDESAPLCDFPASENPPTENPVSENRTQQSTNKPSTNKQKPPIVPQGGNERDSRTKKKACNWNPELFERFWAFYQVEDISKKGDKSRARKAWDKLKPSDDEIKLMGVALKTKMETEYWRKGIGIPYVSTWLNAWRRQREETEPDLPAVAPPEQALPKRFKTVIIDGEEVDVEVTGDE